MYRFARNAVVVASAGTGKTHALVGMLVHVLLGETELGDLAPSRIVATTFSRRAAREIRARLARELERLGDDPASSVYWPLLQQTRLARGLSPRSVESVSQGARDASRVASDVFVGTLHGFALSLLNAFSLEVGWPGGIVVADEAEVRARASRAIARALEARAAEDGPGVQALVGLAGGIDALVSRLRGTFASFEELGLRVANLALAPDDARIIERRWLDLVVLVRGAAHLPRYEAAARAFAALDDHTPFDTAREVLTQLGAVKRSSKAEGAELALQAFVEGLRGGPKAAKLELLFASYEARERFAVAGRALLVLLTACEHELDAARQEAEGLGFGEILATLERLLAEHPQVADEIGARYDALLVDEFQDTSRLQKRLVELLWAPRPTERVVEPGVAAMRPRGLFVVGDRKQSIYGFRGADVSVFAELCVGLAGEPAREKLRVDEGALYSPSEPSADFYPLRTNRRSSPSLLTFINGFSAQVFADAGEKRELFELEYSPDIEDLLPPDTLPVASSGEAPAACVWLRPPVPERGGTTRRNDALVVTRVIQDLASGRRPSALPQGAPPRYKDCAVLALTNDMLDEQAYALAEANVPYVLAGKSFYKAREVLDLASLLALLLDPSDRLAALAVLRGPLAAVSDESLVGMTERGRGLRRVDGALLDGPRAALLGEAERPRIAGVVAVVEQLGRLLPRIGAGAALREAVRVLRLEEVLAALPRGRGKVLNVRKFLSMADEAGDPRALVARVLTRAGGTDDEGEAATFSEEDDAVRLLTVHASKGLDFKVVFVPQMGALVDTSRMGGGAYGVERAARGVHLATRLTHPRGLLLDSPAYERARAMGLRRERAERRRLLYVAMTRASHMLFPVGVRRRPKKASGDAHSTCGAATLEALAEGASAATFAVEDVALTPPEEPAGGARPVAPAPEAPVAVGAARFRTLPIAPTSLQDFHLCARRFELVHLLGLPEHAHLARGARGPAAPGGGAKAGERGEGGERTEAGEDGESGEGAASADSAARPAPGPRGQVLDARVDAQSEGTRMHRVLERLDLALLGQPRSFEGVSAGLAREGLAVDHPRHASLARRLARFVSGPWLTERVGRGATLYREHAFAVHVPVGEGRTALFRGSMDLVVGLPGRAGLEVEVIDYKRARGPELLPYALQLELYALAARSLFPDAARVRAGVVFLGGEPGSPVWLPEVEQGVLEARVVETITALSEARWLGVFPRANVPRCEAIACGYIGRCHPRSASP